MHTLDSLFMSKLQSVFSLVNFSQSHHGLIPSWSCRTAILALYLIRILSAIYSHSTDYSSYFAIFYRLLVNNLPLNRPYFPRPRKYRRLFSEPTYWPRRSRGQYGEGNNQAGIFEAEGNKSLIPGRLARSPLTCPSSRKVRDESVVSLCSERCRASTGSPWLSDPKWFHQLFSTCNRELTGSPGG